MANSWYYREMGSRNKKTGKLSYYQVRVTDYKIDDCECYVCKENKSKKKRR